MAAKKKGMTADEVIDLLAKDPEYVRRQAEQEKRLEIARRKWAEEQRELVAALNRVGVNVENVWDLVGRSAPYPAAVPILLEHLQRRSYTDRTRAGIARSLAVPDAKPGWSVLLAEFDAADSSKDKGAKDGIACALSVLVDESVLSEFVRLIANRRHGSGRVLLIPGLARLARRSEDAKRVLHAAREDPDLEQVVEQFSPRRSPAKGGSPVKP